MTSWLEALTAARETRDPSLLARAVPYLGFLGIDAHLEDGAVVCAMKAHAALTGNPSLPALHGGTLAALLECAALFQVLWEMDQVTLPKTINLTVDYVRSGRVEDTQAIARIVKRGRRVVSVQAEAFQGGDRARPCTTALVHLLVAAR